jgi:hypothetical protein
VERYITMEPFSPVLECPPTDVFRFSTNDHREKSFFRSLSRYDEMDSVYLCTHSSIESENACSSLIPPHLAFSKAELFNKVKVCWECEPIWLTQQSPLKHRSRPVRRFSSLDSNTVLSKVAPVSAVDLRHASEDYPSLRWVEPNTIRKIPATQMQENVRHNYTLPIRTLAQIDGTSDDGDNERCHKSSCELSPWSDVTADTPSKDSPQSNATHGFLRTPPTSPTITRHLKKSSSSSVDLTLPTQCALADPVDLFTDTPTPLTCASPAIGAFPFSAEGRSTSTLTPFTPRSGASPLRPSQRHLVPISPSRSFTPNRRPDRFIAARTTSQSPRESFEISRPADKLVGSERVLRSNSGTSDPFSRHVPRNPLRNTGRPRSLASPPRTGSNGPHNVLGVGRAPVTSVNRQVSNGAVWHVGGAGALGESVAGVANGHNGLLASGTNAPLYSSKFLARIDSSSELEVHERRLALALDLDPSSRILSHLASDSSQQISPTKSDSPSSLDQRSHKNVKSRVWKNNEWVREGSVARLFLVYYFATSSSSCI